MRRTHSTAILKPALLVAGFVLVVCVVPAMQCVDEIGPIGIYNNTTDPTNGGASYVGSAACRSCHASYGEQVALHGHAHALKKIEDGPPLFPTEASRAGVPDPPSGFTWSNIAYVIGGFSKGALFLDLDGYFLTTGLHSVDTQWNLSSPPNGTSPGFTEYLPAASAPTAFEHSCFKCHTTGALAQSAEYPFMMDNRPGIGGTWTEEGAQCESCHGPGSNHIPNPSLRNLYVSSTAEACATCHAGNDSSVIEAGDGFIAHNQQAAELLASGGHKDFACTFCHDPHNSTIYDRERGIRNQCIVCHTEQNMASHDGKTFVRGDYTEVLTCESCHLPFATRTSSTAPAGVVGADGRMGDTRTHIFRISTEPVDYTAFFSGDGSSVVKDSEGRAAVTVDFVCLRCHTGNGLFSLTVERAAEIAPNLHTVYPPP